MTVLENLKYQFFKDDSAIKQIIMINLAVFALTLLVGVLNFFFMFNADQLLSYFYAPSNVAKLLIRPWTMVTNIFFHDGVWHILGNMLWLYFIGRILQDFIGNRKIQLIFLLGGIIGTLFYVSAYNIFPVFDGKESVLLGASGGVMAIVIATATLVPNYQIHLFGMLSIKMKWIALIKIAFDLASISSGAGNEGGMIAHIGGAVFGFLYILYVQGRIGNFELKTSFDKKTGPFTKVHVSETKVKGQQAKSEGSYKPNQQEIDAILDKISQSGYDSLSDKEKHTLFKASE